MKKHAFLHKLPTRILVADVHGIYLQMPNYRTKIGADWAHKDDEGFNAIVTAPPP